MEKPTTKLTIAKRPQKTPVSKLGQPKKLMANYFSFKFNSPSGDD